MLKFFRRIRKKLIDGGNVNRYLVYAAGDLQTMNTHIEQILRLIDVEISKG